MARTTKVNLGEPGREPSPFPGTHLRPMGPAESWDAAHECPHENVPAAGCPYGCFTGPGEQVELARTPYPGVRLVALAERRLLAS